MPHEPPHDPAPDRPDDTPAFAASPPSVPVSASPPSVSPTSTRKCEGCASAHAGTYGSGRFCSATCAKKVGARHKWAARAAAAPPAPRRQHARHTIPDAPCESCAKLHDKSYGSGRFCSVHCARRVAATRKWEKSRSEKSKRLEAIRPAMLAPPPTAGSLPVLTGKRRRVVATHLERLSIADVPSPFYVTPQYIAQHPDLRAHPATPVASPAPVRPPPPPLQQHQHQHQQHPASSPVLSVPAPIPSYLPNPHMQYAQVHMQDPFSPMIYPADARTSLCYGYPSIPSYAVHPAASPVDTASYTATSLSPSPSPSPIPQTTHVQYQPRIHQPAVPPTYVLPTRPAYDPETASPTPSPARVDDPAMAYQHALASRAQKIPIVPADPDKPTETSENAARALLCLQRS